MSLRVADDPAMNIVIRAVLVILLYAASSAALSDPASWTPYWAGGSKGLVSTTNGVANGILIYAPDREAFIKFQNSRLMLYVGGLSKVDLTGLIGSVYLVEIKWSSDSKAFFINASDGGLVGKWSTFIYQLGTHGVSLTKLTKPLEFDEAMLTDCGLNTASIGWVRGHRELLVMQQVPDSSDCTNMGNAVGYIFDAESKRVIEELQPSEIRLHYRKYLGLQAKLAVSK